MNSQYCTLSRATTVISVYTTSRTVKNKSYFYHPCIYIYHTHEYIYI